MATLKEELDQKVAELRQLVSKASTLAVAGWCFSQLIIHQTREKDLGLGSPDRQVAFLLGILLSTPEPDMPTDLSSDTWKRAMTLLNQISLSYMQLYFPEEGDRGEVTDDWRKIREVAMLAFLHYFNSGLLASVEQLKDRITAYITPFDKELESLAGIGSDDAVKICQFISERLQTDLDKFQIAAKDLSEQWDTRSGEPPVEKRLAVLEGLQRLGLIELADIEINFPKTARAFWQRFTVSRGQGRDIGYPTEESIFDVRPLIRIEDNTAFCITANSLFFAVLTASEELLASSSVSDRFRRTRDKSLESQVAQNARVLLGKDATIWESVYETPDSQNEHDVVAFDDRLCIIFEAKASPPREPLRDPDKAFARIRDAFRSDTGIQKAYDQGNRIVQRILKGEVVSLFDRDGKERGSISRGSRLTLCACVTRDDFGPLATNLKLLLEKAEGDAYPWATNILDLSTLAEAWAYFGWDSTQLRTYLEQRLTLHGKVFSAYELDYAGCFIRHGGFGSMTHSDAFVQLGTEYSDVFDQIYLHLHAGEPPVTIVQTEPVMWDMRRSLAAGEPVYVPTNPNYTKVGRNDPCPCGSGKKYKRCHGR